MIVELCKFHCFWPHGILFFEPNLSLNFWFHPEKNWTDAPIFYHHPIKAIETPPRPYITMTLPTTYGNGAYILTRACIPEQKVRYRWISDISASRHSSQGTWWSKSSISIWLLWWKMVVDIMNTERCDSLLFSFGLYRSSLNPLHERHLTDFFKKHLISFMEDGSQHNEGRKVKIRY